MAKAWTIWFTGLHGSGKSTIAENLAIILRKRGIPLVLFDGDELRKTISSDLGYSLGDRNKHMRRAVEMCKCINGNGILAIACVASPTRHSRGYAKKAIKNLFLAYVKCPLEVCEERDVKGHYKKARKKERGFENFIGVSLPFDEPENPDITISTDKEKVAESVSKLLKKLEDKKIIPFYKNAKH